MFSKKAKKIDGIFTVNLTLCGKRQIDGEDFDNFCGLLRRLYELYFSAHVFAYNNLTEGQFNRNFYLLKIF